MAFHSRPWLKKLVSVETNGKSLISISSCKTILFPLLLSQQAEKGQRSGSTIQGIGEIAALWYSRVEKTLEHHCSYCIFFIKKYFIIKMHQTDTWQQGILAFIGTGSCEKKYTLTASTGHKRISNQMHLIIPHCEHLYKSKCFAVIDTM